VGKKSKELREFLEKNYGEDMDEALTVRLACETLLEVVESEKSIELCVVRPTNKSEMFQEAQIAAIVAQINAEKEAKEEEKKAGKK